MSRQVEQFRKEARRIEFQGRFVEVTRKDLGMGPVYAFTYREVSWSASEEEDKEGNKTLKAIPGLQIEGKVLPPHAESEAVRIVKLAYPEDFGLPSQQSGMKMAA